MMLHCNVVSHWLGAKWSLHFMIMHSPKTQRSLVTPYSEIDLSTLTPEMACCLTAPSNYLHQCHLIISESWDNHLSTISQEMPKMSILQNQGSDQFISFNSIQFQFKLDSGFFNSIQFQFKSDSVSFNSIPIPIHFLSIPIQFNSNVMHRNKQINQIIGYFKFNLNISLFAAQFRKYIIQDHNNSRINKSALVQVLG